MTEVFNLSDIACWWECFVSTATYKITFEGIDRWDLERCPLFANKTTSTQSAFLGGRAWNHKYSSFKGDYKVNEWFFFVRTVHVELLGGSLSILEQNINRGLGCVPSILKRGGSDIMTKRTSSHIRRSGCKPRLFPLLCFGWRADTPVTVFYSSYNNTSQHMSPWAKQTCLASNLQCVCCYCMWLDYTVHHKDGAMHSPHTHTHTQWSTIIAIIIWKPSSCLYK